MELQVSYLPAYWHPPCMQLTTTSSSQQSYLMLCIAQDERIATHGKCKTQTRNTQAVEYPQ